MPRSRHLAAYPQQFFGLTEAIARHQEIKLTFATKQELERLRLQWYGFVRAALAEAPELGRKAQATICRILPPGPEHPQWALSFKNRDDDPAMQQLSAALARQIPPRGFEAPRENFEASVFAEIPEKSQPASTAAFEDAIEAWLANDSPPRE